MHLDPDSPRRKEAQTGIPDPRNDEEGYLEWLEVAADACLTPGAITDLWASEDIQIHFMGDSGQAAAGGIYDGRMMLLNALA